MYDKCLIKYENNYHIGHRGGHHFIRQVKNHTWRTYDPEKATLFIVPFYLFQMKKEHPMSIPSCPEYKGILDNLVTELKESKYFQRNGGKDHLIVCTHWATQMILEKLGHGSFFNSFLFGRYLAKDENTILVPFTTTENKFDIINFEKRKYDLFFIGQADYRYPYTLRRLMFDKYPRAFNGYNNYLACSDPGCYRKFENCNDTFTDGCALIFNETLFFSVLKNSRYNFHIRGDDSSSKRIFDGFAHNNINIYLADQVYENALPFKKIVPYHKMSIFMNTDEFVSNGPMVIYNLISSIKSRIPEMLQLIQKHKYDIVWEIEGSRVGHNVLIEAFDLLKSRRNLN